MWPVWPACTLCSRTRWRKCTCGTGTTFALKQLINQREDFLTDAVRYKNRLKSLIDGYIPRLCGLSNRLVEKRRLRWVLPKLIDLNWVNNMGRTRFRRYTQRRDGDVTEAAGGLTLSAISDKRSPASAAGSLAKVNCS